MYDYTKEPTKALLTVHRGTIELIQAKAFSKFWVTGARATVHHIEDELNRRGVQFTPWLS